MNDPTLVPARTGDPIRFPVLAVDRSAYHRRAMGESTDLGALRDLAVRVGEAMNDSGEAVGEIAVTLQRIFEAHGVPDAEVIVFPTALIVRTGRGDDTQMQFGVSDGSEFRLDQVSALYELIRRLETTGGAIDIDAANRELDAIATMRPHFPMPVRVFGHGLLTLGLAFLLQPAMSTLVISFLIGLLIGVLKEIRLPTLRTVFPVVVAFVATAIVLEVSRHSDVVNPIRILVPPLVVYLPGASITIGTFELASNDMVSGASRLMSGLVQLLLLAFGVVAGAGLVGASASELHDYPQGDFGAWAGWVGVAIFGVGMLLHYCSPTRFLPWMLVVLLIAHGGQLLGTEIEGTRISGFFGALVMTPVVLWFDRLERGPTKFITFVPAFWILVPGSAALLAVLGGGDEGAALISVFVTVMSIALGILIGTAVFNTALMMQRRARRGGGRVETSAI